jgi:hypothetical protein
MSLEEDMIKGDQVESSVKSEREVGLMRDLRKDRSLISRPSSRRSLLMKGSSMIDNILKRYNFKT